MERKDTTQFLQQRVDYLTQMIRELRANHFKDASHKERVRHLEEELIELKRIIKEISDNTITEEKLKIYRNILFIISFIVVILCGYILFSS